MKVRLAGFNVDADALREPLSDSLRTNMTPETISAAYARISRDPSPVDELRRKARAEVAKARESNRTIVFGFGHASVAEHAVLNFDVIGLSRLAIEALEHARLASYTEKSQRYQKLKDDYVMPAEIEEAGKADEFRELVAFQNAAYREAYKRLLEYFKSTMPNAEPRALSGRAKEDARYMTSLSMEGQLGMTVNARTLEGMISRLAGHPLYEVRELAQHLHAEAMTVVPSLLRRPGAASWRLESEADLREVANENGTIGPDRLDQDVLLVRGGVAEEAMVVRALTHEAGYPLLSSYSRLFRSVFAAMDPWSPAPRAFECASFLFDAEVSAACFSHLKRHRMATILPGPYDTSLSPTVPPSFREAGLEDQYREVAERSAALARKIGGRAADYCLIQGHRRRVLVGMNGRELYAFARLRMDCHAQWDIRGLAGSMIGQSRERCPVLMAMACGKDEFPARKANVLEALDDDNPILSLGKI